MYRQRSEFREPRSEENLWTLLRLISKKYTIDVSHASESLQLAKSRITQTSMKKKMIQAHRLRKSAVRKVLVRWCLRLDLVDIVLAYCDYDLGNLNPSLKWRHALCFSGFFYTGKK